MASGGERSYILLGLLRPVEPGGIVEVRTATVSRVPQVAPGSLFYLVNPDRQGTPICFRAAYNTPGLGGDEANRVIPIQWPEDPASVGVAVYTQALPGWAAVLEDARVEVDPLSVCRGEEGTVGAVFQSEDRLYFPVRHGGTIIAFAEAQTGEIVNTQGHFIAFERWTITVPAEEQERVVLVPSPVNQE